jgi:stage IV sporulation protein B
MKMKRYKISLYIALCIAVMLGIVIYEYTFYRQIPDTLYLQKGETEELEFALPVTGELETMEEDYVETWENGQVQIEQIESGIAEQYVWKLRLFGMIPLKDIDIKVVDEESVYPIGVPIGIYIKTDGILVAGLGNIRSADGRDICPSENILQTGDYILEINDTAVSTKTEMIELIKASQGEAMILTIRRNGQISQVKVVPALNSAGEYQIGVWIRDSAQGIGTLTYIDEDNSFGALGHGINDIDTTELMEIDYGGLYETQILSIKKGSSGEPGEISGVIRFLEDAKEGVISTNTANGIYGQMDRDISEAGLSAEALYPVAYKQDIEIGPAGILFTINGETNIYDIEIKEIDYSQSEGNRGLVIEVTDPVLLAQTGGIIQGMSGAPIIQNGKLIGAVTHVLVNDPAKGYGIFIENMLGH